MTIKLENLLSGSATVDWDNTSMTGTTKRVTEAVQLGAGAREASWQPAWTDTSSVLGGFSVELSNDAVTWSVGAEGVDFQIIGPAVASNDDSQMVQGSKFRARYARLTYTNISGTGTLTNGVHVGAKRGVRGEDRSTPLTIFGDNLTAWYDMDNRIDGTPPDIAGLTNLANPGDGDVSESTVSKRPHLISKNGRNYAETLVAPQQSWTGISSVPLWPAGSTGCAVGFIASIEDFNIRRMFEIGDGATTTGIHLFSRAPDAITANVVLSTGSQFRNSAGGAVLGVVYEWVIVFDGTKILVYRDDVKIVDFTPTGGSSMVNAGLDIGISRTIFLNSYGVVDFRGMYVINKAPTDAERAASLLYWRKNRGG